MLIFIASEGNGCVVPYICSLNAYSSEHFLLFSVLMCLEHPADGAVHQRRTVLVKKRTVPYRYSKDHSFHRTVAYRTKKVAYRTVPLPPGVCGIPSREIPYRQPIHFFFGSFSLAFNKRRAIRVTVAGHRHIILAVSSWWYNCYFSLTVT